MNTATRAKLDLDTIAGYSAATRDLADKVSGLDSAIEAISAEACAKACDMTKQALADATDAKVTVPKDTLIAAYVQQQVEATWVHEHKQALEQEARKDMLLARSLNNTIDEALAAAADVANGFGDDRSPGNVIHALAWMTDEVLTAQWKAHHALQVIRCITEGKDIREATAEVAKRAMFVVMGFPSHIKANGTGSGYRLEDTTKACAAAWFVEYVAAGVLGDTVPVAWLTR